MLETLNSQDKLSCGIGKGESMKENEMSAIGKYHVECVGADGVVKWTEDFDNLVTTEGKNYLLDVGLRAQAQLTAWYVGLKSTGAAVAGDTLPTHASWTEVTPYAGNRLALTVASAAAAGVLSSSSATSYSINATNTVFGCFICSVNTGTSGKLYSAGDFGASKAVSSGDTLNVSYSTTLS
jgi:hypothetical protein